jgi:DNA-binding NarL/FixJ family response regulator
MPSPAYPEDRVQGTISQLGRKNRNLSPVVVRGGHCERAVCRDRHRRTKYPGRSRARSLTGPSAEPDESLTAREKEVLALIGRGMRNLDVAKALDLAESTVASYIKAIYHKLGISSQAEASWHATRLGLAVPS